MEQIDPEQAKERLLVMREEVIRGVNNTIAATPELGADGVPDLGDISAYTSNCELLKNLSDAQQNRLKDIDAALERIAQGEYGICASCEEEISPRRMEVRPFSRFCIDCKTDIERLKNK